MLTNFTGVDLFSGAGGMSIGAEMAGIKVVLAIDSNKHASETYRYNSPDVKFINDDIRGVNLIDYKNYIKEVPYVLFGGPPCQGFSVSNTKTRNLKNKNNSLFEEFIRYVKDLKPLWFVFENVEGFKNFHKGKVVKQLEKALQILGYSIEKDVLCASDYGVPQSRRRFFMVGNRLNIAFEFPKKHSKKVSVRDALEDLPELKNGDKIDKVSYAKRKREANNYCKLMRQNSRYATQNLVSQNMNYVIQRYKHIKPGQNWKAIPDHLMRNYKNKANCHNNIYKRLDPDKPSVVIAHYRKSMIIHPFQDRGLSVREAARLQSFPDNFIFKGSIGHQQQQIGNAVPPLLAKAIFQQIMNYNYEPSQTNIQRAISQVQI